MVEAKPPAATIGTPSGQKNSSSRKPRGRKLGIVVVSLLALIALAAGAVYLMGGKTRKEAAGIPTVDVVKAIRADLVDDLVLTAEFRPNQEVSLHAKVSGYVKTMSVDIGDHVKEGQVIAELEVPELRDELKKASAAVKGSQEEVKRAEANYAEMHSQFQRLTGVARERPTLVAQQDIDNAQAKDNSLASALGAARRAVEESQAEEGKKRAMLTYASITAPFDGVVTKRYADTGALIQAGIASDTQAMPLIDLAQESEVRLVFAAPESVAPFIRIGAPVEVLVKALDEKIAATITRFSGKMDRATRTMQTEVDLANPDGRFKPGMYASVKIVLNESRAAIIVPVDALFEDEKTSVLIINKEGVAESRQVLVGIKAHEMAEIKSGLNEGSLVLIGNRSGLRPGQKVNAMLSEAGKPD